MELKPIIALDLSDVVEALNLVHLLRPLIDFFKVGSQLFMAGGADIIKKIIDNGADVFLDLKFHDIPKTVFRAVSEAVKLKVKFTTVHVLGGEEMLREAVAAAAGSYTEVIGVTVLTSAEQKTLERVGIDRSVEEEVRLLTGLALEAGLKGIVCSGRELVTVRKLEKQPDYIVVPGIRWEKLTGDDQKRTIDPQEAAALGATHIVVGRSILQANDKLGLVRKLLSELKKDKL
ncbi:orotidine 5'-phosphate decarboxylase [Methylacidiphilum sp. Yel]|jgi:orotidine-5'-phosphate decarboxylase|uniref:orotidine-5'-phosphate decarboxylase n=1 Tax=Methylacidiphilum sp. Yel TaxID=1847730 RepID=UPI00106CCB3D|nr:orotidine-5'-phosphate decarboxylase [Methylacidiphilum sp. Yel]TFE66611.1 orotidine 5'-phosphate decarboxylase [Methylacidiphilum sp. Yel]